MVRELTVADLVNEIGKLDNGKEYEYVSGNNAVKVDRVMYPEGPIAISRYNLDGQLSPASITAPMLAKFALICSAKPNFPFHIDRIYSAGGNARSAFEALLARIPNFFMCNPERVNAYTGEVNRDQKHIMWCPEDEHALGEIVYKDYSGTTITELEASINFGDIEFPRSSLGEDFDTIEVKRVHAQMQIALIAIGRALNLRTWIARNDHSITIGNLPIVDLPGVVRSLDEVRLFFDPEIRDAASLIDCIWFTENGREVPAVIEIEHSTGVTSGLTRMLKFHNTFPSIQPIYTIVAPDELRAKVMNEINQDIFSSLRARYMPYTNVRELYGLIQRYSLSGVVDHRFVQAFMEQII